MKMLLPSEQIHKGKLNLTVALDKRKIAAQLAKRQNRSVSNLFEFLVEKEWTSLRAGEIARLI